MSILQTNFSLFIGQYLCLLVTKRICYRIIAMNTTVRQNKIFFFARMTEQRICGN